jgi:hypothetical protein
MARKSILIIRSNSVVEGTQILLLIKLLILCAVIAADKPANKGTLPTGSYGSDGTGGWGSRG